MSNNGDDFSKDTQAISADYELAQVQWLKVLRSLDTNFVFLFGKQSAGKSAILSALLHVGDVPAIKSGFFFEKSTAHQKLAESFGGDIGRVFKRLQQQSDITWESLVNCFEFSPKTQSSSGFFPNRTESGSPPLLLDGVLKPDSSTDRKGVLDPVNITLLEVAGEMLKDAVTNNAMPMTVDVYFQSIHIPMIFLITVPWSDVAEDDEIVSKFIGGIQNKNPHLKKSHFIVLLTKWDENPRADSQNPVAVVENLMPKTWKRLASTDNRFVISSFSLGAVQYVENDAYKTAPYTQDLNLQAPKMLWNAIYLAFTGKNLIQKKKSSVFEKMFG